MRLLSSALSSLAFASLVAFSHVAHAQEEPDSQSDRASSAAPSQEAAAPSQAAAAPSEAQHREANGEYTAPLAQRTQPSYVPQSIALSGPHTLRDWDEGEPIPAGYHPIERTRKGMIIGGAVILGSMYFFSAIAAAAGSDSTAPGEANPTASMWIPVAGPFIQMAHTSSATANVFLVVDGLAQSGGLAMVIYGISSPQKILMRNDLAGKNTVKVHVAPIVSKDMNGVGLTGAF